MFYFRCSTALQSGSVRSQSTARLKLGLDIGTNQPVFLGGFSRINDTESVRFRRVPNQVLYQAEPLPDISFSPDVSSVYSTRVDPAIRALHASLQNSMVPELTNSPSRRRTEVITPGSH
jgi:hypothetical protein